MLSVHSDSRPDRTRTGAARRAILEPTSHHRSEAAIIDTGRRWAEEGDAVVLATVAHTWGSSPRPVGAVMVLSRSGRFRGSVSGGCIEEELLRRVTNSFPSAFETVEYSSDTTRSLPCGGRLLLTLEPMQKIPDLDGLLGALDAGTAVKRSIDLGSGRTGWSAAETGERTRLEGEQLEVVFEPTWRLLVVGAGELAEWVCRFAQLLDYEVVACDPRTEYQSAWDTSLVSLSGEYPDDFIAAARCDERTAVVALTHDPKIDDMAIIEALSTAAFYIGALGSRRTTARRNERLQEHFSVTADDIGRISGPIGIDLNSRKPSEIALAVMTEITAARNGVVITTRRGDD